MMQIKPMVGHEKIKKNLWKLRIVCKTDEDKLLRRKVFDSKRFLLNCESFDLTLPCKFDTFDCFIECITFTFNNN